MCDGVCLRVDAGKVTLWFSLGMVWCGVVWLVVLSCHVSVELGSEVAVSEH